MNSRGEYSYKRLKLAQLSHFPGACERTLPCWVYFRKIVRRSWDVHRVGLSRPIGPRKLVDAFLWECSCKRLKLGQLVGVFFAAAAAHLMVGEPGEGAVGEALGEQHGVARPQRPHLSRGAGLPFSAGMHQNVPNDSYDRMYLWQYLWVD
jgi:hypothetical protein